VGAKELGSGRFVVKDMRKKLQTEITLPRLLKAFRDRKDLPGIKVG
jgi:hypothetical protein